MEQESLSKSFETKTGLCHHWRSCWRRLIKPVLLIANPVVVKKCSVWIAQNVDSVEELVLSQESAPGTHKTIR